MLTARTRRRAEAENAPPSLRAEFLLKFALLAAAALVLALWTASFSETPDLLSSDSAILLILLVVLDVLIFIALANHLVRRLVLAPLEQSIEVAESIAAGDYERRVPPGRSAEISALATALNGLTDQLLQNQAKLAHNVASLDETNRLLHETQRELLQAEKMASIGRLAAGIAHEIGNPLGALLGYTSVLAKRDVAPELSSGIEREARRIDRIVRELLDYARPVAAAREPVDVNESIGRVRKLLNDQGRIDGVEIVTEMEEGMPLVSAVQHRVDQMFVNLFINAAVAMEGRGRIHVRTRLERYRPVQQVPARRADDPPGIDYSHLRRLRQNSSREAPRLQANRRVAHIIVRDTGPGIPPEHIESVFDPFYTTKAPGEGTGLGLAIVASTVAELGGRIDAANSDEGGAIFHLYLPVVEEDE